MLWGMLNWPGSVPGSPHERSRVPSGANLWIARVAVAVRDVEIALRGQRGVRAAMERLAAHVGPRAPGMPMRQEHLAVERAVADGVVAVVGQPQRVVGRHVDAVRAVEDALAPGAQEVALAVEDDHRVRAAVERVDPVLPVHPDRGHVRVELPPGRQLRPVARPPGSDRRRSPRMAAITRLPARAPRRSRAGCRTSICSICVLGDPRLAERGQDVVGDVVVVPPRPRPALVVLGEHVAPAVGVVREDHLARVALRAEAREHLDPLRASAGSARGRSGPCRWCCRAPSARAGSRGPRCRRCGR